MSDANEVRQVVTGDEHPASSGASWWRLPLLLAVVLVAIIAARSAHLPERSRNAERAVGPPPAETGKFVSLEIDYGDGKKREFEAIPWHPGMTVDDMMLAASRVPSGIVYLEIGERASALVTRIDDKVNDWPQGRSWTYQVNDKPADRSVGVFELQPGDRVLWAYGR
jgi:Domain of unknown function (DUF4430)